MKEIDLNGKRVPMLYCAATENCFERLSGRSIDVFMPKKYIDDNGKESFKVEADLGDYIILGFGAILAASAKNNTEVPVETEYILYDATPQERNELLLAIIALRKEWYKLPEVVEDELKQEAETLQAEDEEQQKNA